MPGTFTYDEATNKAVVTNGTSGAPATFNDMYLADQAGTRTDLLPAEAGTSGPGNSLTYAIRPTHDKALFIKCIVAGKTAEADYIFITGTDAWGDAQTESLDVSAGNGTYTTTKRFATATEFDCSDNAAGDGAQWADGTIQVTQDIWGVIWEHVLDRQYKIDCKVFFGDDVTSTYFQSMLEQVFFSVDLSFQVEAEATLKIGELVGDGGVLGSQWSWLTNSQIAFINEATASLLIYGSVLHNRGSNRPNFSAGTFDSRNTIISAEIAGGNRRFIFGSGNLTFAYTYFNTLDYIQISTAPSLFVGTHIHNSDNAFFFAENNSILDQPLITNASTAGRLSGSIIGTFKDTIGGLLGTPRIDSEGGVIIEQYTVNIHVTDKDGANLQSVNVDCEYAHLVEGTDSKTYKCIQDHTSVDATHKPITGSDWASFWELYDAAGGLGGIWQTTFDFKASTQEFATQTTDANGNITEQVIQYKKWTTTSELLEARIHKITYTHADYPDFVMSDVIVDHPLVWEHDMGQSTADLTAIVEAAAPTVDEIWAKAMVDLAAGAPSATASVLTAINYIFEAWRNKTVTDEAGNEIIVYKDNGTTKLCESDISDDGTLFTKGEYGAPD